ncbi:MAG: LytTR family transcriptional regulator [Rhodospirillaceae bacterium]|nr:LytTR family transcriptional regulator [Rhodospirillaceae bacterium]
MTLVAPVPKTDTLLISIGDMTRPVNWDQIVWLEADGNYVRIFTRERDYFYHRSLSDLLAGLGEDRFIRIHRSRAVNIAEIAGIRPLEKGKAELRLRNGQRLCTSRRFRGDLSRVRVQQREVTRS